MWLNFYIYFLPFYGDRTMLLLNPRRDHPISKKDLVYFRFILIDFQWHGPNITNIKVIGHEFGSIKSYFGVRIIEM